MFGFMKDVMALFAGVTVVGMVSVALFVMTVVGAVLTRKNPVVTAKVVAGGLGATVLFVVLMTASNNHTAVTLRKIDAAEKKHEQDTEVQKQKQEQDSETAKQAHEQDTEAAKQAHEQDTEVEKAKAKQVCNHVLGFTWHCKSANPNPAPAHPTPLPAV